MKLGSDGIYGIHHFINIQTGDILDEVDEKNYRILWESNPNSLGSFIHPITNLEYENNLNIDRKPIKVISSNSILPFQENFRNILQSKK